jgi:Na+-driven multidrug efflux pump
MGLTTVAEAALFSFSAVMMGWIGEVWLAAHGIALQLASLTFMIHLGLSQAATVRAGRAFGRRDIAALREGGGVAMALSGTAVVLTVILFLAIPGLLVGVFINPSDPQRDAILAAGVALLAIAALFQVVDAAQVMTIGLLRGVQDTTVPLVIACVSYWVLGLPAGYLLGFAAGLGGPGIWLGMVIGLGAAAVALSARFWWGSARLSP